jgi:ATP adenylyltransferase
VSLDRLWAAWRGDYLAGSESGASDSGASDSGAGEAASCVFCHLAVGPSGDDVRHVVHASDRAVAVLNAFPYTSGHLLVLPRRHVADLLDLDDVDRSAVWDLATDAMRALRAAYRPDGINLGANIGRAAGAGIPGHVHLHVLPRWFADTNFSTTVAETRVMPEALTVSGDRLRAAWPR